MNEVTLPPSPNWYLSNVIACSKNGTVAWGARNVIVVGKRKENSKILKYSIISNAHTDRVTCVAFAPYFGEAKPNKSTNLLVSGGDEHIIRVWDLDTMSAILAYSYTDTKQKVVALDWSKKNPDLICSVTADGCLLSWNIFFNVADTITVGKLSPTCLSCCLHDQNLVAVGSKNGLVLIVDLRGSGSIIYKLRGHDAEIVSLSWCPEETNVLNGKTDKDLLLASGGKDRSVFIWRAGGDGRYQIEITLPHSCLDTQQHRSKLNSSVGNWTAVCWVEPKLLLASSSWGELIAWDLSILSKNKPFCKLIHACHTRGLFSIASVSNSSKNINENWRITNSITVWTVAQDRQVVCCEILDKSINIDYSIPTQGGYVYCIAACPLDTSRIAFGVGDAMLRLWNLSALHENSFDVTVLWQKIKGKVRAISWHPEKENLLAFGTSEGRVGVFDTNNTSKPPILYRQHHRNTIYGLKWGPNAENKKYMLYSCGEGELVIYNPEKPQEEPKTVSKNKCTEFSWNSNFSCMAVGFENGSVVFLNRNLQECGCYMNVTKKAVHCLSWHPESTATDLTISPMCHYLAIASDTSTIIILNLSDLMCSLEKSAINESEDNKENHTSLSNLHKVVATLKGHTEKVVCLAWSPHFSGHLISGSYDHTVQVWKVESEELMGTFLGHSTPVHCCMWSPLDPDLIITGAADFTLCIWKLSDQQAVMPTAGSITKKTRSKKNKQKIEKGMPKIDKSADEQNGTTEAVPTEHSHIASQISDNNVNSTLLVSDTKVITQKRIKKKPDKETYFPLYLKMIHDKSVILNSLKSIINSTEALSPHIQPKAEEHTDYKVLSLFSNDNFSTAITSERQAHLSHGKYNTVAEMDMWSNNLKETLEQAGKERRLNDFLVSLAPSLSVKVWKEMCEAYANQLISESNPHKAVSYLLCIHKTYQAIETLTDSKLYKEAFVLARSKLDSDDPVIQKVLKEWANHDTQTGNFEQAAQCYVQLEDFLSASKLLARRKDTASLEIAAELAYLSKDDVLGRTLAEQAVTEALKHSDCDTARTLIDKFLQVKHRKTHVNVFEMICEILQKDADYSMIQLWLEGKSTRSILDAVQCNSEDYDQYSTLCRCDFGPVGEDEDILWINVSHQIAMAIICRDNEEKLKKLVSGLSLISQYETVHKVRLQNRKNLLILILCHLDLKSPKDDESIFAAKNGTITRSLRSYLCLGLLNWFTDGVEKLETECDIQPIVILIQDLLEDALDQKAVKYWSVTSEINKLEASLASTLGSQRKTDDNNDTTEETRSLSEKLNEIRAEKKQFVDERVSAASPILVYSKANMLSTVIPTEEVKNKFLSALSDAWKRATNG